MKILLTGANGFLGWHTQTRLRALTDHDVVPLTREKWGELVDHLACADAVIHVAGVNRADDPEDVRAANVRLAQDLACAIRREGAPLRVVFANSIQSGNGTSYGTGKQQAADLLADVTAEVGGSFVDALLPNLFGEHGRPAYNSFVTTFVHAVINGEQPTIQDRPVELLHAQGAAQVSTLR